MKKNRVEPKKFTKPKIIIYGNINFVMAIHFFNHNANICIFTGKCFFYI
jgi:hypothetical protein